MSEAVEVIRSKGHEITSEEAMGVTLAILLHDIGHGPFSHALEHTIVSSVTHEDISALFMKRLNDEFGGQLSVAIEIFNNRYPKKFLHQLVSSQLDMDRLDYLKRDSFYSGVSEGVISSDRIIKMLNVRNDSLCVEQKGIYSIEKFIVARRLMYWQVYLHKAVVAAEFMLVNILKRAKQLAEQGQDLFCTPSLHKFLYNNYGKTEFEQDDSLLLEFSKLDDYDILSAIKVWSEHDDVVLSRLCGGIINRKLFKVTVHEEEVSALQLDKVKRAISQLYNIPENEAQYFMVNEQIVNNAYNSEVDRIHILYKNEEIKDIADASDNLNISALASPVTKYFLCYPKGVKL